MHWRGRIWELQKASLGKNIEWRREVKKARRTNEKEERQERNRMRGGGDSVGLKERDRGKVNNK